MKWRRLLTNTSKKQLKIRTIPPRFALYQLIDTWTRNRFCPADTKTELAQRISSLSSQEYRLYTVEVMNLCLWVKRFAEGMVEADGENQSS